MHASVLTALLLPILLLSAAAGCAERPQPAPAASSSTPASDPQPLALPDPELRFQEFRWVDDLPQPLIQLETVFWDARDTVTLVPFLAQLDPRPGSRALEIGTGTGLIAIRCLHNGFDRVVATDINPAAVANAHLNAERFGYQDRMDVRQVSQEAPSAYAVIGDDETFDLIVSNPPWVNRTPQSIDEFALYDRNFELLTSILDGLPQHLRSGGKVWLIYGCVDAIRTLQREAAARGFTTRQLDGRELDSLPEEFLPGMVVEVQVPIENARQ